MMPNEISHESKDVAAARQGSKRGLLPVYGLVGAAAMIAGEILLFREVAWVAQWFTPIMWTGYILLVDAVIRRRKGTSLLSDHPLEFLLLAIISIGSWAIFEGYNVLLKNWTYTGLPENLLVRYAGYAWSFATITPVMLLTYELLDTLLPGKNPAASPRLPTGVFYSFVIFGAASMVVPFIWPSTYM